ncbi:phenoloxidase 2-like isoform X1 [Schistocerca gregaria]|uniref:phenoloxidase 2-like isoform X1 n=2 Tax=Schistocerca gregaria TaxID=7010 RepID=UPI00211E2B17|nr:phenoloxidase 2-like isoform X1 [Schistocerca gregaria]
MESFVWWWPLVVLLSIQHVQAQRLNITAASRSIAFNNHRNVLYLFDRVAEPLFLPKGEENKIVFKLPPEYLTPRYQSIVSEITDRWGGVQNRMEIDVKPITLPDLSYPMTLSRRENFSPFLPHHRKMASRLVETFLGMRTYEDFLSLSVYCRDRINPYMYTYALSIAMLHRSDTHELPLPPLTEVFPDKYMDGAVFSQARQEANVVSSENRLPIVIPLDYTASDLEPEHRVAYFREDIGINLLHWQWHLYYPFSGMMEIVKKDRRGELFYYFHQQIIARYNFERLSNKLARVKRLLNWHEPVEEGYFPKLDNIVSSRVWPPRNSFTTLRDINRELDQIKFDIQDLERWRDRIFEAIHSGSVINEKKQIVELTETDGIDILGNIVDASILSINPNLYGDLHNLGHVMMGFCHDPDARHLETFGVIADPATTMRDPIFYRWHAFIDGIFQEHKKVLPRYTVQQLNFDYVHVTGVEVISEKAPKNEFVTYWQQNDIDLSRGLDFAPRGPVFVRFTHLQHAPFVTKIQVENKGPQRAGTVRIFMAPKYDERGLPMLLRDQRSLFIEIDKFSVQLKSGSNIIQRRSDESSVTIPFERTFRNLTGVGVSQQVAEYTYCGCGWPQHMLIPKGRQGGLPAEFFVMVSDGSIDKVEQPPPEQNCRAAHSYCGLHKRLYPDRRSMGYPFDRVPRDGVNTLREFMTPNMGLIDVKIRHYETTVGPGPGNVAVLPSNLSQL